MNLDRVAGKAKEMKGKAKQDVGRATGGDKMAASGVKDEAAGKLQKGWGKAKDALKPKKVIRARPLFRGRGSVAALVASPPPRAATSGERPEADKENRSSDSVLCTNIARADLRCPGFFVSAGV